MRNPSISRKIILRTTVTIATLWIIGTVAAALNIRHEVAETLDAALQQSAQRSVPLVLAYLRYNPGGETVVTESTPHDDEYLMYQVRKAGTSPLLLSSQNRTTVFPAPLQRGFWEDDAYRYYTEPAGGSGLFIQIAEPKSHRQEAWLESASGLLYPLLILVPASIAGIWISVRQGLQPLKLFRREIIRRGQGNLQQIQIAECPQELAPIVEAVNTLLTRLEAALDAERAFSANSAHELRTPVATALAQTQQLVSELPAGSPQQDRGEKVEQALKRLARLSEKLLQLTRAEAGIGLTDHQQALGEATRLVLEDFSHDPSQARRLDFDATSFSRLNGKIDTDAYAICLRNLIENALAHGNPNAPIRIWTTNNAKVHVANACEVIPSEILNNLTNRFTRTGNKSQGTGLGLAIVKAIITSAGGELTLVSPRSGAADGFEAILVLP